MSNKIRRFGIIGYPLSHSFSPRYFNDKFEREGLTECHYDAYPLLSLDLLPKLLDENPSMVGLSVTIPYKTSVMKYLDSISDEALDIGAVNTIKIENGKLKGYNSDVYGFELSLRNFLPKPIPRKMNTLVLGAGGAAKAVMFALKKMGIAYQLVSRQNSPATIGYEELADGIFQSHHLIVNTTPLGMSPDINTCPPIPYELITPDHYFFDLVYNPAKTLFLEKAEKAGGHIENGLSMLHLQAERAWEIWNN